VKGYFKDGVLLKIISHYEGDRETVNSYYYFAKEKLIYVQKKYSRYSPPKWEVDSRIIKNIKQEMYFVSDHIVKWEINDVIVTVVWTVL